MNREAELYQQYKTEIETDGPDRLLFLLVSGKLAIKQKIIAAERAIREYEDAENQEARRREEGSSEEAVELAEEANKISRSAIVPRWTQVLVAFLTLFVAAISVYLYWTGLGLESVKAFFINYSI